MNKKAKLSLIIVCVLSAAVDFLLHRHSHFGDHGIDGSVGFYALMALIGCILGAVIAQSVGVFVAVEETFYDHS